MKLRTYYLLLAATLILPLAAGSGVAMKMLLDAQRQAAVGRIAESSHSIAMMVDADLLRARAVMHALGGSQALAQGDLEKFYREAGEASAGEGAWVVLYAEDGRQVLNTRLPFGHALPVRRDMASLKVLMEQGGVRITGMRWGRAVNAYYVAVEQPVVSASGQRYALSQVFSPAYFDHVLKGRGLPASWLVDIVDDGGTVIAGTGGAARANGLGGQPGARLAAPVMTTLAGEGLATIAGAGKNGDLYAWTSRVAPSGWSVIVGAPVAEIDAAVRGGIAAALAGMLLAVAAASVLAVRTGRRLLLFMRRAGAAAALLGQGRPIAGLRASKIREMEALNAALRDASLTLAAEQQSRAEAEAERNELLVKERAARAVAEAQNAAKDEFLAMLGHELRNPLGAISAAIALLEQGGAGTEPRARQVLRRQTDHLRRLVDDLLDVNRALMGKLTLQRERLDLARLARECVELRCAGGRLGRCALHFEIAGAAPKPVLADATRLMQVIDNILDNAVKYSPDGGAIDVTVGADAGGGARLTVRDNGIGIPPDLLPRVFDVFVQGEQTLQRALGGLGIGLTLARRLVEMHGGTIRVDSAGSGRGAEVTVVLPPAPAGGDATVVTKNAAASAGLGILLVEDNVDAREMLAMMLELLGHRVTQAGDGPAAIAALQDRLAAGECLPDLALVDIGLPGMSGHALARALKADAATAPLRLVALSGYGNEESRQTALAAGFAQYFTKPLAPEQLGEICAAAGA
jgi:signal transduction histidine kinase/ActR/RegA family two-component response regulator